MLKPGAICYETLDGGGMPLRVVAVIGSTRQYLVQLQPRPRHRISLEQLNQMARKGYFTLRHTSISTY